MKPLILANIKGHLERAIIELYYAHAEVAFDNTDAKSVDVAITLASARNLVESVRTLLLGASEAASCGNSAGFVTLESNREGRAFDRLVSGESDYG